jgi:hypothetical protein
VRRWSALIGALLLTLVSALDVRAQSGGPTTAQYSAPTKSTAAWTSGTANNTALTVTVTNLSKVIVTLSATTTMTGGTLNFEVDDGSGTWWATPATRTAGASTSGQADTTFALSVVNQGWELDVGGWTQMRVRLNPQVTGSGTATIAISPSAAPAEPQQTVSQPVAANLNGTVIGAGSAGTANAGVVTVQGITSMTKLLVTPDSVALPANQSVNEAQVGGVAPVLDACQTAAKSYASFNQTTTTQILGAAGASNYYEICSINVVTATAQNIALIDSATAGNACATSPAGSSGFGGSTAATGWNFAANGGLALGSGQAVVGKTSATNRALCLAQSSSGQVSGGISYVVSTQ